MFVKISSLVVCLVFIQSTFNVVAGGSLNQRHPRALTDERLTILPENENVYEGSKLQKECHYSDPEVDTWWSHEGTEIPTGKHRSYLIIENVTSKNDGIYTCNAKFKAGGSVLKKNIEIRVIEPTITPEKVTYPAKLNASVTLSCLVEKQSLNNFTWHKLNDSKNVRRFDDLKSKKEFNVTHYSIDLPLENVTRNDNGTYVCVAQIGGKNISSQTHLRVLEKPEVRHFDVSPTGTGTVRLDWTLSDGNSPVTEYKIYFKTERGNYVDLDEFLATTNCTSCSHNLAPTKKLENGKSYIFKIIALNSEGSSDLIESKLINMSEIDPMDTIPTKFNTTATAHSIKITWQRENLIPKSPYYYKINVTNSLKPGSGNSYNSAKNATQYEIEKLMPSTNYTIKIQGCLDDKDGRDKCTKWTNSSVTTIKSGAGSSSVSLSAGGLNLITFTSILSIFLFKYDDVRSFISS